MNEWLNAFSFGVVFSIFDTILLSSSCYFFFNFGQGLRLGSMFNIFFHLCADFFSSFWFFFRFWIGTLRKEFLLMKFYVSSFSTSFNWIFIMCYWYTICQIIIVSQLYSRYNNDYGVLYNQVTLGLLMILRPTNLWTLLFWHA